MDLFGIGATVSGLAQASASWYNAYQQSRNSAEANAINRDSLNWQKQQWEQVKNREDTAVQRRAADLQAAGLSKTLAAGSAAGTSSAPSLPSIEPVQAPDYSKGFGHLMDIVPAVQDIAKTQAETDLIRMQEENVQANTLKTLNESAWITNRNRGTILDNAFQDFQNGLLSDRWQIEQDTFKNLLADSSSRRALNQSSIFRNSWLNQKEKQYYDLDMLKYGLDKARYQSWQINLLDRLSMDKEMNAARMSLLSEQALETQVRRQMLDYDFETARNTGTSTNARSGWLGTLARDLFRFQNYVNNGYQKEEKK